MPLHTLWAPAEERVAAGIAWLDTQDPEWFNRIKLDKLDLDSWTHCILGQLYGNYSEAPRAALEQGISFGFWSLSILIQRKLETIWAREIRARREES